MAGTVVVVRSITAATLAAALAIGTVACGSDGGSVGTSQSSDATSQSSDATSQSAVGSTVGSTTGVAADGETAATDDVQRFPDVIEATAERVGDGWTFSATISSPYDSVERYADAWRVVDPDGIVLGVRELTHDHAAEQPFTRSLAGLPVPDSVDVVTIEARDSEFGWGGSTVDVELTDG
jgi:hypothetical protein